MYVDVDQAGPAVGMAHRESGLLDGLAHRGVGRSLARFDVAARLEPCTGTPVNVQHGSTGPDDDRGRGHVRRIRVLREWKWQALELLEEPCASVGLSVVGRDACRHGSVHRAPAVVTFHRGDGNRGFDLTFSPLATFTKRECRTVRSGRRGTRPRGDARAAEPLLGPTDADDAWSETFIAALRAYPRLRPDSNVRAWLVTIAHRKAIDHLRAMARAPVPVDELPELEVVDDLIVERDEDLWGALQALPFKQRGAVAYHHLAGLPYAEVGVLLDSSETAARRAAADGIANLRKHTRGTST